MKYASLLLACLMISGCAGAPSGGKDKVQFISNPEGATVTAVEGASCITPCAMQIRRDAEFTASFSKEGYETAQVFVGTQPMASGKSYSLGPLSVGVETATVVEDPNGLYTTEHTPNPVTVELVPLAPAAKKKSGR